MDLDSTTLFLAMTNLGATGIQIKINNVLGRGTVAHSTVTHNQL
jgi:hypothetical protein